MKFQCWGGLSPEAQPQELGSVHTFRILDQHLALAQLVGSAKSLGLPLFGALCKIATVVGFFVLGNCRARESSN